VLPAYGLTLKSQRDLSGNIIYSDTVKSDFKKAGKNRLFF